ncbi:helix-turn-helix transcriptional regulator [Chitinophaga polysaccharea]|nr:helix-turn-helix transcriptional regulator [Chitinophaga polysaccharea]NLU96282.1 helix-turn-helix transcriptional regulator [Chitinophaga sp. Ak27]
MSGLLTVMIDFYMQQWYNKIDPILKDVVQTVLILESADPPGPEDLPIFTNGMSALLCTSQNKENRLSLFGKTVPTERWAEWGRASLIAFFFKPFALGPVFKLSAQQLKNGAIELNRWNPQKAMALTVQLAYASSTAEKVEVLHQFVLSQVTASQRECMIIRYATDKILENPEADVLAQMLQELNLTERTFQRIFKKYVGITANEYRRICQFQLAFYQLKSGQFDKLTDVAYANGYFDQSHYIRSFKEFTATTPNDYLQFGLKKK